MTISHTNHITTNDMYDSDKNEPIVVRPIYKIAEDIRKNWKKVNYAAKPYLDAMRELDLVSDNYGCESASEIINRFLVNSSGFRGNTARKLKLELKMVVGNK